MRAVTAIALVVIGLALVAAAPPNDPPNAECDPAHATNLKSNNHGKLSAAMKLCIESKVKAVSTGILNRFSDQKVNGVDRTHRWDGTMKIYTNGPKAKFQKWDSDKANFDTYIRGFTNGREMYVALKETVALEKVPPTINARDLTNKLKAVLADSLKISSAIDATGLTGMDVAYGLDAHKADRYGAYRLAGLATIYPKIQQVLNWLVTQQYNPDFPANIPDTPDWASSDAKYQAGEKDGWAVAHNVVAARKYSTSNGFGNYFVLMAAQSAGHGEKCMECPIAGTTKILDITGDTDDSLQTRKDLIAAGILNDGAGNPRTNPNQYNIWPKPDLTELVFKQIKVIVAFRAASNVGKEAGPYLNDKGAIDYTTCSVQGGVAFRQLFKKNRVLQSADV